MPSYYESLDVDPNAPVDTIEAAIDEQYKQCRWMINHHDPNVVEQANRALRQLEVIRETLTNPEKRAVYDQSLNVGGLVDLSAVLQNANSSTTPMAPPVPKTASSNEAASSVWKCVHCGNSNRVGSKTCTNCGTTLARECPNGCGNIVHLQEKFCSQCGKSVENALAGLRQEFEQNQQHNCDDLRTKIVSKQNELDRLSWFSNNVPQFKNPELEQLLGMRVPQPGRFIAVVAAVGVVFVAYFQSQTHYIDYGIQDSLLIVGLFVSVSFVPYRVIVLPAARAKIRALIERATAQRQEYIRHVERHLQEELAKTFDPLSPKPYVPDAIGAPAWEVVLNSAGNQKVNVVWIIRLHTELGVRETKDLVESTPSTICTTTDKYKADSIKSSLEKAGASVAVISRVASVS